METDEGSGGCYFRGMDKWLKKAMEFANISQAEVARRLTVAVGRSIDRAAVNKMLSGKRDISADELLAIANITGYEMPRNSESRLPRRARAESSVDRDLDTQPFHETVAEIDVRVGAGGGGLPVDTWIQDGNGNTYAAEGIRDHWEIPPTVMREMLRAAPRHIRAFEVIGDSMEPRLSEGDRVFIDLRYTIPSPEGMFALWDGYGVVIKRVQIVKESEPLRVRIISANASYDAYDAVLDDIKIIGRYAGRFTVN